MILAESTACVTVNFAVEEKSCCGLSNVPGAIDHGCEYVCNCVWWNSPGMIEVSVGCRSQCGVYDVARRILNSQTNASARENSTACDVHRLCPLVYGCRGTPDTEMCSRLCVIGR